VSKLQEAEASSLDLP